MTNEEAIKMLQTEKACVERQERKQNCNRFCESCDLCMPIEDVIEGYNYAIRALKNEQSENVGMCQQNVGEMSEKQTDGDLISRQAVLDNIKTRLWQTALNNDEYITSYAKACEDIADNRIDTWVNEVPSAEKTAEWKTAKWKPLDKEKTQYYMFGYICSICGAPAKSPTKYCPNCGAKMKESEEK